MATHSPTTKTPEAPSVEEKLDSPLIEDASTVARKNGKFLMILASIGVVMFLFAFANVPLFGMLCSALGIPLSPLEPRVVASEPTDREVKMIFLGTKSGDIPLQVSPVNTLQMARLGEVVTNDYRFVNLSDRWVYFYPIHTLQPIAVADLIDLSKCFCFNPQKIAPGARVTLPVVYQISSDLPENYNNLTMNYTMFEITEAEYEKKLQESQNLTHEELKEAYGSQALTSGAATESTDPNRSSSNAEQ
ncbi:MAG: cytochrome c oxidase assembly protein [Candidatus Sumerlaeia bacterium]|nr:cytochrome c oxidase assembly protein [Candidatus Sumerlaeia bacterium]